MKKIIIVCHSGANRKAVSSNRINDTFKYITGDEKILVVPRIYPWEQEDEFDKSCFSKIIYTSNLEPNLIKNWTKNFLKEIRSTKNNQINEGEKSFGNGEEKKLHLHNDRTSSKIKSILKLVVPKRLIQAYRNFINFIDPFKFNIPFILYALFRCCRGDNTIIFVSAKPVSYLIPCVIAKKLYKTKIIFDLRDNWIVGEFISSPLLVKIEKKLKIKLLKLCDQIITVSEPIKDELSNWTRSPIHVITNGFDGSVEDIVSVWPSKDLCGGKIKIGYFGNVYEDRGEDLILEALEGSRNKEKIQFDFYGRVSSSSSFYTTKYVSIHNMVLKKDLIETMRKYDYLLLLLHFNHGFPGFYSGKVFEYIRTGIPILALVAEKGNEPAINLIKETKTGIVVNPADTERLKELFDNLDDPSYIQKYFNPRYDIISRYSRKNLAKKFENVITSIYEN